MLSYQQLDEKMTPFMGQTVASIFLSNSPPERNKYIYVKCKMLSCELKVQKIYSTSFHALTELQTLTTVKTHSRKSLNINISFVIHVIPSRPTDIQCVK